MKETQDDKVKNFEKEYSRRMKKYEEEKYEASNLGLTGTHFYHSCLDSKKHPIDNFTNFTVERFSNTDSR